MKNSELNKFLNRSKGFIKIFSSYRKFAKLTDFVNSSLSSEQRKFLELEYRGEVIDFKTQLLIYFDDRYSFEISVGDLKARITKVINKYKFLFTETTLSSNQVRTILLRELMEVISIGSQCFHILGKETVHGIYCQGLVMIHKLKNIISSKYLNLPPIEGRRNFVSFYEMCFGNIYRLVGIEEVNEEDENIGYLEFFKREKGFLEMMNTCEIEFANKYREKYFQIACNCINVDINSSHRYFYLARQKLYYPVYSQYRYDSIELFLPGIIKDIKNNPNTFLKEITEEIINFFKQEELEKFKKVNSQGEPGSLKEQLLDRYYSKYPSFASLETIKQQIKKKISQYKPLLLSKEIETEVILELFMDELEKELFVSKSTYIGNEEMIENLNFPKTNTIEKGVVGAINQILKLINLDNLEIEERKYDLCTLLNARGKRAGLAQGKTEFKRRLLFIFNKTLYHPISGNLDKQEGAEIYLQAFFTEIDSCFLFPRTGRNKKVLLNLDDTSSGTKLRKLLISKLIKRRYMLNIFFKGVL